MAAIKASADRQTVAAAAAPLEWTHTVISYLLLAVCGNKRSKVEEELIYYRSMDWTSTHKSTVEVPEELEMSFGRVPLEVFIFTNQRPSNRRLVDIAECVSPCVIEKR